MTPEQIEQIQAALEANRQQDIYNKARDIILEAIGRAYAEAQTAEAHYNVLTQRVTSGDLVGVQQNHVIMQAAMAGQDAVIQQAGADYMAALESAQASVHGVTGGRFLPVVPLEVPELTNKDF